MMENKSKKNIKVIVAHPGRHTSFKNASALKSRGFLFKYITTVYYKPSSIFAKLMELCIGKKDLKRFKSRRCEELSDDEVIQFCPFMGFIEILFNRIDNSRILYRWWHKLTTKRFGRKVAKYAIKHSVDAVISFDTNSKECFEVLYAKAPHILRILDPVAVNRLYMRNIYEEDMKKTPQFAKKLRKEVAFCWDNERCEYFKKEIQLADYVIAHSQFIKESILYSGFDENKIFICYLGIDSAAHLLGSKAVSKDKLSILYVGNVTQLKGISYLLEALDEIDNQKIEVTIVGKYDNSDGMFDDYIHKYNFTGAILYDEVKEIYKKSDIFIFPSLGDGFGTVALEAMSFGLPIICSANAGATDSIQEGENGFVVPAGDSSAIREKIEWFLNNKEAIPRMGENARQTVKEYSWENYNKQLADMIYKILNE